MKILQNKCKNNTKLKNNIKIDREQWIDYTKAFACILVVIGHLLQGLKKAGIQWNNTLYQYIDTFIYLFHMPLFMFLSGYLYSKTTKIDSIKDYFKFIKKKAINLGIPFVFFYMIHIVINIIFSKSVNTKFGIEEISQIFIKPIAPFWFLYALFFIFLLIPIIEKLSKKNRNIVLLITLVLYVIHSWIRTNIYALDIFMQYSFYFYLGVFISNKKNQIICGINQILNIILYIVVATLYYFLNIYIKDELINRILVMLIAVIGIFAASKAFYKTELFDKKIYNIICKYNFQIYLLHTIFCAGTRIILNNLNIYNFYIHFIFGTLTGIVGPIIVGIIAEKNSYIDIIFFPLKNIKKLKENKNENCNDWT